jgi:S-adenosylmethionine hydrolase
LVRRHLQGTRSEGGQVAICLRALALTLVGAALTCCHAAPHALVLQTDFGTRDGAVSTMRGVALGVAADLPVHDLTHEIPPFDIWQAACRLQQTAPYWPPGSVFVSVVDPGVGTDRLPIVARDGQGRCYVTPDNGTLTLLLEDGVVQDARIIDTTRHRRPGSADSHTFHGRDVFALVGAELASGRVRFEEVGNAIAVAQLVRIDHPVAEAAQSNGQTTLRGFIPVLDVQYGNVWTNLPRSLLAQHGVRLGSVLRVRILDGEREAFAGEMPYVRTFGDVATGAPLAYDNSLGNLAVALNTGDFARAQGIGSGPRWRIEITWLGPSRPER